MSLSEELRELLRREGCGIVGFADLSRMPVESTRGYTCGVVIALPFTKDAVMENRDGAPQRYYAEHSPMDERFKGLKAIIADFLAASGYDALTETPASIVNDDTLRALLSQKTVATLSGIGWIGKNAMLVTEEAGSAVRLTAVLTNAPLECGTPTMKSKCDPDCTACAEACPGKAPLGRIWEAGIERDAFFDARACQAAARARGRALLGIDRSMCGLCAANCPFTKKALGYE